MALAEEDPFPSRVRCRSPLAGEELQVVWWHSPEPYVRLEVEEKLIPVLMHWGMTEMGMMRSQPAFRLQRVRKLCRRLNVPLFTALSLRRHHIHGNHPSRRKSHLQLGKDEEIRDAASLFEAAVESVLRSRVDVWSEKDQKEHLRENKPREEPFPPTPDFILHRPILWRCYHMNSNKEKETRYERIIHCASRLQ